MPTWFILLLVALFGACIASFCGVIIDRLPLQLDEPNRFGEVWDTRPWTEVLGGRSNCSSCGTQLRAIENVPVVAWIVLRGRCRTCHERIPATNLAVEIVVPLLAVWAVWVIGWTWTVAPVLLLVAVGTVVAVIDLRTLMVPTRVVWPGFFLAVAVCAAVALGPGEPDWLLTAAVGVAALAGPLFVLWWVMPRGMGFGDVRLAVLLGWISGFEIGAAGGGVGLAAYGSVILLTLAAMIGILLGVVSAVAQIRSMKTVPFGPPLAAAAFVVCLAAPHLVDAFG